MLRNSFFYKILLVFILFTACLSISAGILVYISADYFGSFIVAEQARPVMRALIVMHTQFPGEQGVARAKLLASALNAEFYIGKEIPRAWHKLPRGVSFINGRTLFVYKERANGRNYALSGSSKAFRKFMSDTKGVSLAAGLISLLLAAGMAVLLSGFLARPLVRLSRLIGPGSAVGNSMPRSLLKQTDEVGMLAREISRYQEEVAEFSKRDACFTSDLSHELRTPLTIISGCIELLNPDSPPDPSLIARLSRSVHKMTDAVTAALCLARKAEPEVQTVDMRQLLEEQIGAENALNNIRWHTEFENPQVKTQRDLAAVIIGNLIQNALKRSEEVEVFLRKDSLVIINSESKDRKWNGSGLGLSIVRRGCAKLGWQFDLKFGENRAEAEIRW